MNESLDYLTTEIGKNFAANASIDELLELNPELQEAVSQLIISLEIAGHKASLKNWDLLRQESSDKRNK